MVSSSWRSLVGCHLAAPFGLLTVHPMRRQPFRVTCKPRGQSAALASALTGIGVDLGLASAMTVVVLKSWRTGPCQEPSK